MPTRPMSAIFYGLILWAAAAGWTVVASTIPGLWDIRTLPYVSNDLVASLPVIIVWAALAGHIARRHLQRSPPDKAWEGYLFGQLLLTVVSTLDLLVFVVLLDRGNEFYYDALLWVAYAVLVLIPWRIGKRLETESSSGHDALARALLGE